MKLYFIRHGQSEANVLMEFSNRGFRHPLTELGLEQATNAALALAGIAFQRVYSSPVMRAIQTTSIITAKLGIRSFEVNEALREYDVGILEGRSDPEGWQRNQDLIEKWRHPQYRNERIEGGESLADIQARFSSFIVSVLQSDAGKGASYLIVSHGGVLGTALPAVMKNLDFAFTSQNHLENCGMVIAELINNELHCRQWGDHEFRRETPCLPN